MLSWTPILDAEKFYVVKMKGFLGLGALLLSFSLSAAATQSTAVKNGAVSLKVITKSGSRNKTAPFLHGLFFEDINVSYLLVLLKILPDWTNS